VTGDATAATVGGRRLVAFYVTLAIVTAVAVTVVIAAGSEKQAQREIAGIYSAEQGPGCLGREFAVKQSGQFVNLENADGTLSGRLHFEDGRLTGAVSCVDGNESELEARARPERIEGRLDGMPVAAELVRDPPPPGAQRPRTPGGVAGEYALSPESICLGGHVAIEGDGSDVEVLVGERAVGQLEYHDGTLVGRVRCKDGETGELAGTAVNRDLQLTIEREGAPPERLTARKQREFGETLAIFFVAVALVMLAARLVGAVAVRIKQPRVMGEVVAGILLGPTLFGMLLPDLQATVFPTDVIPLIGVVANLGLIFYMFLVGLELDAEQLKGRITQAAAISNASVALPMVLGLAAALYIYELVGPDEDFVPFALYMGVAMSITAFPVLARILVERRMLKRPVGALALACAAIDDVTAWFLIALATAVAVAGSGSEVVVTIALAIAFCLAMGVAVRPLLARVSAAYDEAGRIPSGWIAAIFAGILLSAYTTETIGIALIFGAFVMGMIMPRRTELTEDVTGRVEDFVVILLLPLFFAFTGLRTNIGLLDRPELWLMTVGLIVVAIVGKLVGAMVAARVTGFGWRPAAVIGTLMNTRGLTELIVLNLALEAGVISEALFAMLVIMALTTTFMAGPLLNLIDPRNEFGGSADEELDEARRESEAEFPMLDIPERSILLAPQTNSGLQQLLSLAEPLARSDPPRELILARLVRPPRGTAVRGGLQTENRLLQRASAEVTEARNELIGKGTAARSVAFISADPGADLSRVAQREGVDLVLIDGRRPLLGEGVPRGEVGRVLEQAPCDVGVLVAREGADVLPRADRSVLVPFGGAEHDWAALELAAWISSATGAPLRLLGAAGRTDEQQSVSRMLGDAGLLLQQYAGVTSEPVVTDPGRESIVEAAVDTGLLVVGLSDRWRQEGLGPTRSEIAHAAPAPVLFVRRGTRPGALAPATDVTRFSWSSAGVGGRSAPVD
jgi:Kef-type K+ transport system membrane component KefB